MLAYGGLLDLGYTHTIGLRALAKVWENFGTLGSRSYEYSMVC